MNNHDYIRVRVSDDTVMNAYVAFPEGDATYPALIILQEAFG